MLLNILNNLVSNLFSISPSSLDSRHFLSALLKTCLFSLPRLILTLCPEKSLLTLYLSEALVMTPPLL